MIIEFLALDIEMNRLPEYSIENHSDTLFVDMSTLFYIKEPHYTKGLSVSLSPLYVIDLAVDIFRHYKKYNHMLNKLSLVIFIDSSEDTNFKDRIWEYCPSSKLDIYDDYLKFLSMNTGNKHSPKLNYERILTYIPDTSSEL